MTGVWLRPRNFRSRQDFIELCRDKVFYVVIECGQDQRVLCCTQHFCVVTVLVKVKSSMS